MEKAFYQKCIQEEVIKPFGHKTFFERFWSKYVRPESNSVYLLRTIQYVGQKGDALSRFRYKCLQVKAMRRYGMAIPAGIQIGLGLRIVHPHGIHLVNCTIGENFTVFQNCTIGAKHFGETEIEKNAVIGNNVTMYANSMIFGRVHVADNVQIAANACLVKDALEPGLWAGTPATRIK